MDTKEARKSFKPRGCIYMYSTAHGFQELKKKKTFKHTNTVCSLSDSLTITDSVVHCTEYRIKQLEIDNLWGQIHTFNAP